jgi:ribosomal protein RSM22 (predicted rRNA methylase)
LRQTPPRRARRVADLEDWTRHSIRCSTQGACPLGAACPRSIHEGLRADYWPTAFRCHRRVRRSERSTDIIVEKRIHDRSRNTSNVRPRGRLSAWWRRAAHPRRERHTAIR